MAETPPLTDIQNKLTLVAVGVDALLERPTTEAQLKEMRTVVVENRASVTEAVGIMHSQMSDVLMRLDGVGQHLGALAVRPRRPAWQWLLVGAVLGMLAVGGVWRVWPESQGAQFAVALDKVLDGQYAWLPKGTQVDLRKLYGQFGYAAPGERK